MLDSRFSAKAKNLFNAWPACMACSISFNSSSRINCLCNFQKKWLHIHTGKIWHKEAGNNFLYSIYPPFCAIFSKHSLHSGKSRNCSHTTYSILFRSCDFRNEQNAYQKSHKVVSKFNSYSSDFGWSRIYGSGFSSGTGQVIPGKS